MKATKGPNISHARMRDLINQLADIIYILCKAKEQPTTTLLNQLTNMTPEEQSKLNIFYPKDEESQP